MASPDVLLILMPWMPPSKWLSSLEATCPGIEVKSELVDMYGTDFPAQITADFLKRVTVLFTWKTFPSPAQVPQLQYVQLLSAGCTQIMGLPLFEKTDIAFCTSNGVHPPQIAEWVFSTFLAHQHHQNQKLGRWVDPESDEDTEDAVGLRMGILGYGCVGRQCARVAEAFGMDVVAYTLHERTSAQDKQDDSFTEPGLGDPLGEFPSQWFHGGDQLDDFLSSNLDLLVITLPLTEKTRGMISHEQFSRLSKKRAYVCNAGRGAVIDTEALIAALEAGQIRGAALDVTDPEPLPQDHKLWSFKNVIITPHCAGNSNHYNERALKILSHNLQRRLQAQEPVNRVSKTLGY